MNDTIDREDPTRGSARASLLQFAADRMPILLLPRVELDAMAGGFVMSVRFAR